MVCKFNRWSDSPYIDDRADMYCWWSCSDFIVLCFNLWIRLMTQKLTCMCSNPLYKGETYEYDGKDFCSAQCMNAAQIIKQKQEEV